MQEAHSHKTMHADLFHLVMSNRFVYQLDVVLEETGFGCMIKYFHIANLLTPDNLSELV